MSAEAELWAICVETVAEAVPRCSFEGAGAASLEPDVSPCDIAGKQRMVSMILAAAAGAVALPVDEELRERRIFTNRYDAAYK